MTHVDVGSGCSQKFFPLQEESSGNVYCQLPPPQPAVGGRQASFGVGNAEWALSSSHQLPQGFLTPGLGEGHLQPLAVSSGGPETKSRAVTDASLRNCCLFLLDTVLVPGRWDAVFIMPSPFPALRRCSG